MKLGIRVALGGQSHDVITLILGHALKLMGAGLLIGWAGALAGSRLLTSTLFGVSPLDPATFIGAAVLLALAGLLASYLPARRATKVDPIVALRSD